MKQIKWTLHHISPQKKRVGVVALFALSHITFISCADRRLDDESAEQQGAIQRDMGHHVRSTDATIEDHTISLDMHSNMDETDAVTRSDQDLNQQITDADVSLPLDLGRREDIDPSACVGDEECNDGVECTEDLCNVNGECTNEIVDGACLIDDVCVSSDEVNPENECLICDSSLTNNQWTSRQEFACDDGDICTTESFCDKGVCEGIPAESCCGNGVLELGETCDGDCLDMCPATDMCSTTILTGTAETCDVQCVTTPVNICISNDGCCPSGCSESSDNDCVSFCGNGVVEEGELCDGDCPSACFSSNQCSNYHLTGSAQTCDAECVTTPILACVSGDGCCPDECTPNSDADCNANECELRINIMCSANPDLAATYQVQALDSDRPNGFTPHGYLFHSGNWPDQQLLPNWCLSDTGIIALNAQSGCVHATYEIGQCLPLDYPKSCESTLCYVCP